MILFSLTISALILFLLFEKLWKPTLIEIVRDDLFCMRDTVRDYFLQTKKGLKDPAYAALREYTNNCLRHTESISLGRIIIYRCFAKQEEAHVKEILSQHSKAFSSCNADTRQFVKDIHDRCAQSLMSYILAKSFIGMLIISFILPIFMVYSLYLQVHGKVLQYQKVLQDYLPKRLLHSVKFYTERSAII